MNKDELADLLKQYLEFNSTQGGKKIEETNKETKSREQAESQNEDRTKYNKLSRLQGGNATKDRPKCWLSSDEYSPDPRERAKNRNRNRSFPEDSSPELGVRRGDRNRNRNSPEESSTHSRRRDRKRNVKQSSSED